MSPRWLRSCCALALGAAALALDAASARAEAATDEWGDDGEAGDAAAAAPSRYAHRAPQHAHRLAVGMGALIDLASREEGAVDLADQGSVHSDPLLSVAFGSQLTDTWVIGLRLAYATKPFYSDVSEHQLWQLAAEARWQPEGELGPYAIASGGGVASVDDSGGISAWQLAPSVGGALGFDVALSGPATLGFELRALGALFRNERESFAAGPSEPSLEYALSSWLGLNVIATLGVGEGAVSH